MDVKNGKITAPIGDKFRPTLERYDDRQDEKWYHADLTGTLYVNNDVIYPMTEPGISREERVKESHRFEEIGVANCPPLDTENVTRDCYVIKGLNEGDPDIKVYVVKPKNTKKKKLPVLFAIGEGGMTGNRYEMLAGTFDPFSTRFDCAMVFAQARNGCEAFYPAPIDDYQAAYQWMLDNGDSMGLNTKNVVLYGDSGGGFTVLAFAFRCKRVGFSPKGCMACEPILNDMLSYPSSKIVAHCWDALEVHRVLQVIFREGDQFSPFVGPEHVANHATVEDCVGLCPMYLHTMEMDSDRDPVMHFASKLYEAKVFTQVHVWAGGAHGAFLGASEDSPIRKAYEAVRDAEIHDMFTYDFRRPWTVEEAK